MIPAYAQCARVSLTIAAQLGPGVQHRLFSHVVSGKTAWRLERQALRWGWEGYRPEQLLINATPQA